MNTLKDHKLLIDTECPLCVAYSSAFEHCGLLERSSVLPYAVGKESFANLDVAKGRDEIALVNTKDGSVTYGVDSLVKILATRFAVVGCLCSITWVKAFLKKVYSFISFNRKVIVPSFGTTCAPSYSFKYRALFIFIANLFSSYVLYRYSLKLHAWVSVQGYQRELILSFGQLAFQSLFLLRMPAQGVINYLGNLSAVSLIGALLLMGVLVTGSVVPISGLGYLLGFGLVVGLIFLEHWRRVKLLEMPVWLCLTWVVYRSLLMLLYL